VDDTNINYFENYEDLNYKYEHYKNKSLLDIINIIYEEDELKLNNEYKLINVDEYKFLINSLIKNDYNNLKIRKHENIRLKLFNHLKEVNFTMKDLLRFLNMIEPIFNNSLVFIEKNYTYAQAPFIYNLFSNFEYNNLFEKWKLKYLVIIIQIFKLFDVPILKEHNINKYWMNKYNFEQRRDFIEYDLNDCGTFENMGTGALFYYKNVVEDDEKLIKINQYKFINIEILNEYNNLFYETPTKIKQTNKNTKQKIINVVSAF
jgi:hypothetical protein